MLEAQGLGEAVGRPMKALSKGMAQKVQLICALAHEPDLVILDEPFSGLDPVNQQTLEDLIRSLAARGATVVFSTHVMSHAERLCDRIVLMARGRKAFDGTVEQARATAPRQLMVEGAIRIEDVQALPGVARVDALPPTETGDARFAAALKPGAAAYEPLKAGFAKGLDLKRFETKEPTLHDAFILLTGEAGR
jgi:ABC-2 type transport system ATP-binding protein